MVRQKLSAEWIRVIGMRMMGRIVSGAICFAPPRHGIRKRSRIVDIMAVRRVVGTPRPVIKLKIANKNHCN